MTQKAFSLEAPEQQFLEGLNNERQQALAQYGALALDMETARKAIESTQERQRAFVRQALMQRGVHDFQSARVNGTNLECVIGDTPGPVPIPDAPRTGKDKTAPNGAARSEA
jgi:hypothetical protein